MIQTIQKLKKSEIKKQIETRYLDFVKVNSANNTRWFSELCFCILTANTSAQMGIKFQNLVGHKNFSVMEHKDLLSLLKSNGYRFHNKRAEYIVNAREYQNIKRIVSDKLKAGQSLREVRNWLAENIKGIGYKEASHFLRNIGYDDVAILDKHVLNLLIENKLLKERPKTMNKKNYEMIEKKLDKVASKLELGHSRLDMYMWYIKTGKVLK